MIASDRGYMTFNNAMIPEGANTSSIFLQNMEDFRLIWLVVV